MHTGDDDEGDISNYYGVWPGIMGLLMAAALIWFMFHLADGFA